MKHLLTKTLDKGKKSEGRFLVGIFVSAALVIPIPAVAEVVCEYNQSDDTISAAWDDGGRKVFDCENSVATLDSGFGDVEEMYGYCSICIAAIRAPLALTRASKLVIRGLQLGTEGLINAVPGGKE